MKQIVHILGKDLRRYAWAWITLLACAAIEIYLLGTTAGLLENRTNEALSLLVTLIGGILFFILIVMVVQEETLVDPDAYWLSRPIGRGRLLVSKLLFLLLLIGAFQITETITLLMNGGGGRVPYALLEILGMLAVWQAQIFLAAQTRSLPLYLLLVVSIFVGFFALSMGLTFIISAGSALNLDFDWGLLPATIAGHWLALIQTLFWLLVGLAILFLVYLKRRIFLAWLLLIPAIFVAILLTPGDSFFGVIRTGELVNRVEALQLDHLRKGSVTQVQGDEFVEVLAVFSVSEVYAKQDIWASVLMPKIQIDGREFGLETGDGIKRFKHESGNLRSVSLGYAKLAAIKGNESNVSVDGFLQLSFSVQAPVGTLKLKEGATYSSGGDRLVIRSITRNENDLEVDLAGSVPQYRFEPHGLSTFDDPFGGRFSFGLVLRNHRDVRDFDLAQGMAFMSNISQGRIKVQLNSDASLEDYHVSVFSREITHTEHFTFKNSIISFQNKQ